MKGNHPTESLETVTVDCLLLYFMPFKVSMTWEKSQSPAPALSLHYHLVLSTVGNKDLLITDPQPHKHTLMFLWPGATAGPSSSCRWWRKRAQVPAVLTTLLGVRLVCCHPCMHIEQLLCLSCDSLSDLLVSTSISLAAPALSLQP